MKYTSWFDEMREDCHTPDELVAKQAEWAAQEKQWSATDNPFSSLEEDLMNGYTWWKREKELFDFGERLIRKYPKPEDAWWLANTVYSWYGRYYLLIKQQEEALKWFQKALDNEVPSPNDIWEFMGACYVELGDEEQANHWILKYKTWYEETHEGECGSNWEGFAKFYFDAGMPERALTFLLEVKTREKCYSKSFRGLLAKVYRALGDYANAIVCLEEQVAVFSNDDWGYSELAFAYYDLQNDADKAIATYLKCLEVSGNDEDLGCLNSQVYYNLSIIAHNECRWEECFQFLNQYFLLKYPPDEAAVFTGMISRLPPIEDFEMGTKIYHAVLDFEKSPLRPGRKTQPEEKEPDNPESFFKGSFDNSYLTNLGEGQAN